MAGGRGLTAGMLTAVQADTGEFFHLISLAFSTATTFLTTAANDVTWSGDTYTAVGGALHFDAVQEGLALQAQRVRLTMDGVDTTIIVDLLSQNFIGRTAKIYLAHFGSDGTITADPYLLFSGVLNDRMEVEETFDRKAGTCTVRTTITTPLTRFGEVRGIRSNEASHSHHFNGDTFFRHINGIAGRKIFWGGTEAKVGFVGGGGGGGDDLEGREGDTQL